MNLQNNMTRGYEIIKIEEQARLNKKAKLMKFLLANPEALFTNASFSQGRGMKIAENEYLYLDFLTRWINPFKDIQLPSGRKYKTHFEDIECETTEGIREVRFYGLDRDLTEDDKKFLSNPINLKAEAKLSKADMAIKALEEEKNKYTEHNLDLLKEKGSCYNMSKSEFNRYNNAEQRIIALRDAIRIVKQTMKVKR